MKARRQRHRATCWFVESGEYSHSERVHCRTDGRHWFSSDRSSVFCAVYRFSPLRHCSRVSVSRTRRACVVCIHPLSAAAAAERSQQVSPTSTSYQRALASHNNDAHYNIHSVHYL